MLFMITLAVLLHSTHAAAECSRRPQFTVRLNIGNFEFWENFSFLNYNSLKKNNCTVLTNIGKIFL